MPQKQVLICHSLEELDQIAKKILHICSQEKIWLFEGNLGAGKTTLIKAISRNLGVVEAMSSPTFGLVNEYRSPQATIYHIDCYRLRNVREAVEIGIFDYLDSGNYCFIEWAERIAELLDPPYCLISLEIGAKEERIITLSRT